MDRPPPLIWLFQAIDALGGATALRLLGALVAGLTVLLAAQVAKLVAQPQARPRAVGWTAALTAALLANPMIDVVAVKGELLALPALLGSIALTLLAVRRRSGWLALAAGVAAGLALGLKQNLGGGLVFAFVLLVVAGSTGRLPRRDRPTDVGRRSTGRGPARARDRRLGARGGSAALGALVRRLRLPLRRRAGDRGRQRRCPAATGRAAAADRARPAGLLPVLAGLFVHIRELWSDDPPVVAATLALVATDVVALVAGGSYWQDYLLPLIPGAALCAALLAGRSSAGGDRMRARDLRGRGLGRGRDGLLAGVERVRPAGVRRGAHRRGDRRGRGAGRHAWSSSAAAPTCRTRAA